MPYCCRLTNAVVDFTENQFSGALQHQRNNIGVLITHMRVYACVVSAAQVCAFLIGLQKPLSANQKHVQGDWPTRRPIASGARINSLSWIGYARYPLIEGHQKPLTVKTCNKRVLLT